VPVLVLQGGADEYGTDAMLWDTAAALGANAEPRLLPGVGHRIHRQEPDLVADAILGFVATLLHHQVEPEPDPQPEIGDEMHTQ
jgi:pimeloyl-ACP methyl ester carboxylesterase